MSETKTSAPPAVRIADPIVDRYVRIGEWLAAVESGDESAQTKHKAAALRLYLAHELGLPPLAAAEVHVIRGNLVVSAKLLRALASEAGYRVVRISGDAESCTAALIARETGEEIGRSTFTIEDAKRAKLVREKSGWTTHPARMLWARASKFAVDDFAPEVSLGLLTEEEAEEIGEDGGGADFIVTGAADPPPSSPTPESAADDPNVTDAEWTAIADEADEKTKQDNAHARVAILVAELEQNPKTPTPDGHASWEAFSRWLAGQLFGVESRSELNSDQLTKLREELDRQSVPFG